jgi:uncharacterized protein (DUF1800 family)
MTAGAPPVGTGLSRRALLAGGAGSLGAVRTGVLVTSAVGALGAAELATAPYAEAARTDPILHLVRRATYGPTPATLAAAHRQGRKHWLEHQLHPAKVNDRAMTSLLRRWPRLNLPAWQVRQVLGNGKWDVMFDLGDATIARAAWSNRQLLEVMVDFWSNHLNVTNPSSDVWATRHLYDRQVIRRYALGKFSDLLVASAKSPAMLLYLDNANSSKQAPNENYARELLELHTVGLHYSESDVKSAARLLTGMSVNWDAQTYEYKPWMHATGRVKVLGWSHPNSSTAGEAAAVAYLRYLAHHPQTARHIAQKLAVRFVSDSPSAGLVTKLAKVYKQHDTDIRAVLRALFLSHEFAASGGQKVRRPYEDLIATLRALGIRPPRTGTTALRELFWLSGSLGQPPMGWHPPNGYPDVAAAWSSAGGTLERWNSHLGLAAGWWPNQLGHPKLASLLRPAHPSTYGALVDAVAAGLALPRPTSTVRAAVCTFLGKRTGDRLHAGDEALGWRLPYVFALVLDSPAFVTR